MGIINLGSHLIGHHHLCREGGGREREGGREGGKVVNL